MSIKTDPFPLPGFQNVRIISRHDPEDGSWVSVIVAPRQPGIVDALHTLAEDTSYGSNGPGQPFARKPVLRISVGHVALRQRGGLDI